MKKNLRVQMHKVKIMVHVKNPLQILLLCFYVHIRLKIEKSFAKFHSKYCTKIPVEEFRV